MHELAVTESILQVVLRHASAGGASKVVSVGLRIGEVSDLVDEWVQRYFDHLSRGTIAEGAVVRIERSPAMFRCGACGHSFPADPRTREAMRCPLCASEETTFVSGREYLVQQIEVL
ncbi:MAG: hydrogenase maturation nickel metallochaperone HypA [Proteobacteria bacterium]|nr:hydrogenase maturation nickel metallochaperone HypA [Pseudomonadota bacterium]